VLAQLGLTPKKESKEDAYTKDSPFMRYSLSTLALANMRFENAEQAIVAIRAFITYMREASPPVAVDKPEGSVGGYL